MLKIEVKKNENKDGANMTIQMAGSFGDIIREFSAVVRSVKEKLADTDDKKMASTIFSAAVIGAAMGIDDDDVVDSIKTLIKEKKDE